MAKQSMIKKNNGNEVKEAMPLWASMLIERFDNYSCQMQRTISDTLERFFGEIQSIKETQNLIIERLSEIEKKVNDSHYSASSQKSLLYSSMVKIKNDSQKIEEKSRMIAWIGIDELASEEETRRFDHEILREAIYTSGDDELKSEFDRGQITSRRYPVGKPRKPGARGRIIKITLPNQALRDSLLAHMRSGRQSLTQKYVHSFARRDYTEEELHLDRALRKEAGQLNAQAGKLLYIVRDFDIIKLKAPRDLPHRSVTPVNSHSSDFDRTSKTSNLSQRVTDSTRPL